MNLKINPTASLNGEITAPGSKSYSHRAFIAASLADGLSVIKNPLTAGDVEITIKILQDLKVNIIKKADNSYIVDSSKGSYGSTYKILNCQNSGTTLRIFSGISLLIEGGLKFSGEFIRKKRPIIPLLDALKAVGGEYKLSRNELNVFRKQKICNAIKIQGDISSQFLTALLIISPRLACNNAKSIEIEITTPIVSYPYVQITLDVLKSFGINVLESLDTEKKGRYLVSCGQNYRPQVYEIPGDFSSAAFIIAASVLSKEDSKVIINNLDMENPQGDKKIVDLLREMGASIDINEEKKTIIINGNINKYPLKGIEIDCKDTPDLFPILSVIGAFSNGKTTLFNAKNLRHKESDRIASMARELTKMNVKVEEGEDKLIIHHCESINGSSINHSSDHRIAMACIVAALCANSSSQIESVEIISDSYPAFIEDLKKLGASLE